ncbi:MAG: hypothetical protein ACYCTH_09520 [Cellulomonas sp.]
MQATTELGHVVVHEGEARVVWARPCGGWQFERVWPSSEERRALRRMMADGSSVLVVLPLRDVPVVALGAELGTDEDVREIDVPVLDWLPPGARRRGLRFRASVAAQLSRTPTLLRPAVVVSPGRAAVRVAVKTSSTTSANARAFDELADHLFAPTPRGRPPRLLWPRVPASRPALP